MKMYFLLLISITGAISHATVSDSDKIHSREINCEYDLDGMIFLFPKESVTDYVILQPELGTPLKSFTICLRAFTDLTRSIAFFSVSSSTEFNNLILYYDHLSAGPYSLYVGGQWRNFRGMGNAPERKHLCGTWDSSSGVTQFWLNGEPLVRQVMAKGHTIEGPLKFILGQEQDSFGGSFEARQSFVGEMGDVHLWDYVLSPEDIHQAFINNKHFNGNVISWRAVRYEIQGDVLVEPMHQSVSENQAFSSVQPESKSK
ncbi:serum amyloid P-component-like isoform X1 [Pleurodeles waltl]